MLASLLCCNDRFSTDFADSGKTEKTQEQNNIDCKPPPASPQSAGNLGGLEDRASHNGNRAAGRVEYPQDSDRKRLSTLFESIKSGLGAGSHEDDQHPASQGAMGGATPVTGGGVVQRVSCRRRRDSNSSSNSDSEQERKSASSRDLSSSLEASGQGRKGYVPRYARSHTESAPNSVENVSGDGSDSRLNSLSLSSDASVSTVKEGQVLKAKERQSREGHQHGAGYERGDTFQPMPHSQTRQGNGKRMLPKVGVQAEKKLDIVDGLKEEDRPSSGCSFTSSEWGDVTPTDSQGISGQSSMDRREEAGSALAQSSGYVSASRKNDEEPEPMPRKNHQRKSGVTMPPDDAAHSSLTQAPEGQQQQRKTAAAEQVEPTGQVPDPDRQTQPAAGASMMAHVRRQSSGRSETFSLGSARTASPATKMRLLDMASNRALERDGDSVKSWSAGSEDTLSLGMSCSGMHGSPEIPASLTQKVHYGRRAKGGNPEAAENFQIPSTGRSRVSDGDHASESDHSAQGSPDKRGSSQHLSVPSVVTSHTGSSLDELRMTCVYWDSRESLASVYSDAGEINYGRIPVTGDIVFGLDYDHKRSTLLVNIRGCHDLAPVDVKHNRSDPYVKVYLLPDKTRSGKRKSKIKKHTLSPVYNETLTYNISKGELENRTLWVTVWHSDRFGRNDFLGEVLIPMDTYRFDDPSPCAYSLQTRMPDSVNEEAMQYKGELIVSLMYVTPNRVAAAGDKKSKSKSKKTKTAAEPKGEIHTMIKAAKNLTAVRSSGASDPFVKGYLLPDRARTGKQKTSVVKNSVNPMWNHILVFDSVEQDELADRCLELTVWDHEKLGTNEFLGGARLNMGHGAVRGHQVEWMDARGEEAIAWQNMIDSPNSWIDARLPLRASMGKPSKK